GRDEKQQVVPRDAVERCGLGSRKDQERERQHQRDQQIEIFSIELGIVDEEPQRELLVDTQENGGRSRDYQRPAPAALQDTHPRDFGFLQVADTGVRILELYTLRRSRRTIGRRHHLPPTGAVRLRDRYSQSIKLRRDGYCSKPSGILALAS